LNRGTRVFAFIARQVPGLVVCKDILVVAPTEHILRGFALETTTERDLVYLWRVIMPLYVPVNQVFLNYSDRIHEGKKVFIDRKAYDKAADVVRSIVVEHIPFLQKMRGPREFLQHISWMTGNPLIQFRFHLAITNFLLGNLHQAQEILSAISVELDQPYQRGLESNTPELKKRYDVMRDSARCIHSDPGELRDMVDSWERQSIDTLGLGPSLASYDGGDPLVSEAEGKGKRSGG
jgi:hypothetical protein